MLQAFLAWDTSHVLSMGPCCDDHRQPRRCGQSCSPGCTGCHRVTPCLGVADPRGPSRTHLAVVLQRLVRATDPKFRRGHAPRHSIRADSRALDPSPAHPTVLLPLLTHGRPSPRVVENAPQTASTAPAGADRAPSGASSRPWHPDPPDSRHRRGHSARLGARPSGQGHSTPSGTAIPSPNASPVPGRTEMSPHAQDVPSRDARVWGIHGIPSHWCASCTSTDLQPRPPGPAQAPEAAKQGKAQPAPGEGRLPPVG